MTDPELRNRFNFGATPSLSIGSPRTSNTTSSEDIPQHLPGAYATEDLLNDIPDTGNVELESPRASPQNQEKTCRICLSGAEDGMESVRGSPDC
jgi:hypothetical protein